MKRILLVACVTVGWAGWTAAQMPDPKAIEEMTKAMQALSAVASNAAPVVDFRELKAMLPADLAGMKRTAARGEKNGAMGMTVSEAQGSYETATPPEGEDAGAIRIKLTDMGGVGAFGALAQFGWAAAEIDRETDTGYEKTTTCDGFKAHEQYDTEGKHGSIQVLVGNRFIVEVEGDNVEMTALQAALKKIELKKLSELKPKPKAAK